MTEPRATRGVPLGSWLSELPDEQLIRLLELRPDLAQPAPGSVAALAARAGSRQSIKAAADELNYLQLAVLDALLVLCADQEAVPVGELVTLIDDRAPRPDVLAAVDALRDRALVWGDAALRVSVESSAALPWFPGQAVAEAERRSGAELTEALDELDDPARDVLERLVGGSPVGRGADCSPPDCSGRSTTRPSSCRGPSGRCCAGRSRARPTSLHPIRWWARLPPRMSTPRPPAARWS